SDQLQARRTYPPVAHSNFGLYQLDELHEVVDRVHAKQRKEPAIQLERLVGLSLYSKVHKIDGFARKRIGQASDPAGCTHTNGFEDGVVHADRNLKAAINQRADRGDSPGICTRFFYGFEDLMFIRKVSDLFRKEVG